MKELLLSSKNLCKSFSSNGNQVHILNNIDLEIYKGDFTVIMGSSGSGKSTLLYSLSCMDRPTSGSVNYKNKDIAKCNEKEISNLRINDFGFVFQKIYLVSNLSLYENIKVSGFLNHNSSSDSVKERAQELLKSVNIYDVKDNLPSQVSGGEAQRAAILRAVINKPEIIFADEPTGALNRRNTEDVLNLFTKLNNDGQTILMVTHDLNSALRADRILYLEDGKICGELKLPKFDKNNLKDREAQVNSWLTSMQW